MKFHFEDLDVWQRAVEFADGVIEISENLQSSRNHFRLVEQLEAAATSIAMNIAEGKGRYSKKEFAQSGYALCSSNAKFELVVGQRRQGDRLLHNPPETLAR